MKASRTSLAVLLGVLLGAWAGGAQGGEFLVAGNERALWLIQTAPDGRFDLVVRPAGGKWQWIAKDRSGSPVAAVAVEASLHVAFSSGQYHVFGLSPGEGAPGLSLPAAPVALCPAAEIGLEATGSLVALVPLSTTTTSAAATQPSGTSAVEVLTNTVGRWQHLTTIGGVPDDAIGRILATACKGVLYLLVPGADGRANRLAAWQGGQWRDLKLPPALANGRIIATPAVEGRLVVVVAIPTDQGGRIRLEIATVDQETGTFAFQPITSDEKEASWAQNEVPTLSVLADKLAIVWRSSGMLKLAPSSLTTGRLEPTEDVRILQQPPQDDRGEQIREFSLWILLLLILVPLFLLRPAGVPKPFSLPAPMVPAPLVRRLAATIVDLLPFHLATSLYLQYALPMPAEEMMAMMMNLLRGRGHMPVPLAIAWAAMIVTYLPYCVLMELRYRATLGKMLLKLRVVGDDGARPGLREVLLRNLIKILEIFFFVPLLLAVLLSRYRQRLGDMAAHTAVIDTRFLAPPTPPGQDQTGQDDLGPSPPPPS